MKHMQFKLTLLLIKRLTADAHLLERRAAKRASKLRAGLSSLSSIASPAPAPAEPHGPVPQTFVIESFFARELITLLTPRADEEMHFLTGPKIGPVRVIARWAQPVSLEKQSPVFVRASAKSVADVLIPIIEQGAELHVIAHSHPGHGEAASFPSSTDIACLGKLQKNGSPVIGCIVTRDGYIRFFSVSTNFHVMVQGTGVKEVNKNVFRIER